MKAIRFTGTAIPNRESLSTSFCSGSTRCSLGEAVLLMNTGQGAHHAVNYLDRNFGVSTFSLPPTVVA